MFYYTFESNGTGILLRRLRTSTLVDINKYSPTMEMLNYSCWPILIESEHRYLDHTCVGLGENLKPTFLNYGSQRLLMQNAVVDDLTDAGFNRTIEFSLHRKMLTLLLDRVLELGLGIGTEDVQEYFNYQELVHGAKQKVRDRKAIESGIGNDLQLLSWKTIYKKKNPETQKVETFRLELDGNSILPVVNKKIEEQNDENIAI